MVKKRPIRIVRCLLPSDYELVQTLEIHNTWADKMIYDILLPSKVYAYGETIPVSFNIAPLASQLRVRSVVAVLKEYCTYNTKTHSKTDTRIVRLEQKDKPFTSPPPTDTGKWTYVLKLEVPQHPPLVFCNAENDMIRIKHKLKFVISLVNADGHFSELRCAVPVVIIDSFAQQSELNMLPSYDQTWRSVPYEQAALDVLATSPSQSGAGLALTENREPITISGRTRSVSISSTTSPRVDGSREEDPNLWWHGMNLSRVPSYGTAMQNEPAPFSSSLPAYDQLSMSPHRTR
ncbi:uncharacterized protein BYT42DRAFT_303596 [Radiomyces spectabilis]|uniref:uncharacterized protein n=1 Tax=Radiomyces spectabilis TaxID=64574 RepID=UPI002220A90F|nr:uncharacterized protein BYT42DRAFT_303596 [Radiomyces spectabilis]KAI8381390.1 hypothetical protein BYT42DRAFT_303596 [Radiomyces spectabilis]